MAERPHDDALVVQWLATAAHYREFARLAGPLMQAAMMNSANLYAAKAAHRLAYLRKIRALGGES